MDQVLAMRSEDLLARLGNAVRHRRLELNMTQEQLAEKAGVHTNYLGGIERGERNVAYLNLRKLAEALGWTLSELAAAVDEPGS